MTVHVRSSLTAIAAAARTNARAQGALFRTLADLRNAGVDTTTTHADEQIHEPGADGFGVHLGLDVIDSVVMGAVNCPQSDDFTYAALTRLLTTVLHSPKRARCRHQHFRSGIGPDWSMCSRYRRDTYRSDDREISAGSHRLNESADAIRHPRLCELGPMGAALLDECLRYSP
jgi:hypothetical protein